MKTNKVILGLGVAAAFGVAALPVASNALSVSGDVQIDVEVGSAIAMDILSSGDGGTSGFVGGNTDEFGLTPVAGVSSAKAVIKPGQVNTSMNSKITVYTNAASYDLSVAPKTASVTALVGDNGTIPAIADTTDGTELVAGTAGWGFNTDGSNKFHGLQNATTTIVSNNQSSGSTTTITYGVSTADDQPQGTYENVLVYTATAND